MRIMFTDKFGSAMLFDDEQEFLDHCENEEVDFDNNYPEKPKAWFIPDNLDRVNVEQVPSRYAIRRNPDSTEIPAPRPGETVSDYARRITGA